MKMNKKGFTLVELLISIAILGVLAAGVLALINPVKRLNQANDAKVKSDLGQIASAIAAYYAVVGAYPPDTASLVTNGDLKNYPTAPTGYTAYTFSALPAACTTACTSVSISSQLKAPLVASNLWCYRTSTGTAVEAATCPAP